LQFGKFAARGRRVIAGTAANPRSFGVSIARLYIRFIALLHRRRFMKIVFNVLGVLCLPVGAVWILQGLDIMRASVMSGHKRWILIGGLVFVAGVAILFFNNRKKAKSA
jgi:hypothetical protein